MFFFYLSFGESQFTTMGVCALFWVYPFTGLDYWTGLLDWTTGLEYWTGLLDWTTGLDYWTDLLNHKKQFSSVN